MVHLALEKIMKVFRGREPFLMLLLATATGCISAFLPTAERTRPSSLKDAKLCSRVK